MPGIGRLEVEWLLETHVHADHLSAAPCLQRGLGGRVGIGQTITVVQDVFGKVFNAGTVRDSQRSMPKLIVPSIRVTMRAGRMPPAEAIGTTCLQVPLDTL